MAGFLIWVFTVDIQLTFCCESCDVSIMVEMTMKYICSILMLMFKKFTLILNLNRLLLIILKHFICKVVR